MGKAYAVIDASGKILYESQGFVRDGSLEAAQLSQGMTLYISGDDPLLQENERLKEQLKQAEAANTAKEVFLSNMSHDIRTPMNAIVGMTALAQKHIDEKVRVADALSKIETASGHLLSLINDVLDTSRLNSGRMKLSSDRFSLSDLLHEITIIVRPLADQKHHTWQLIADDIEMESFYGDALQLRQIIVNIVNNAIKYTEDGGRVTLRVSEKLDGDLCRLNFECEDNGVGMSPDFLKRVFEPFERVNNSTVSRIEGTGLGMSIVKKLVDAMGGDVSVQSTLGVGTTVTVSVPLPYERVQPDGGRLRGRQILIIEADEKLRTLYNRYLNDLEAKPVLVGTAAEALSALTEAAYRGDEFALAVIGSKQSDDSRALDVAAYLHRAYPQLPLLLANEESWERIEYEANRCGIRRFLALPFFRKSLTAGLLSALYEEQESSGSQSVPDLAGQRILLVEDNPINTEIAREILSMTNAEIDTAENGQQALDCYTGKEAGYYRLILMDIQMPVMDGYAATRAIRATGRADASQIPIYAMTANTFAEDIARAAATGMNGHIAKPIDIQALMQVLRTL